jgi:hypothetical protein
VSHKKKPQNLSLNKKTQKEMRKLVLARLQAASDDLRISIGSTNYNKKQLLKKVQAGDKIGQEIINIQIEYLRDMAKGAIYKNE